MWPRRERHARLEALAVLARVARVAVGEAVVGPQEAMAVVEGVVAVDAPQALRVEDGRRVPPHERERRRVRVVSEVRHLGRVELAERWPS